MTHAHSRMLSSLNSIPSSRYWLHTTSSAHNILCRSNVGRFVANVGGGMPELPKDVGDIFDSLAKPVNLGAVKPTLAGRFYQRSLPAAQVPFSSLRGRRFFKEALDMGHMENYFFLAEQFRTQDEPTFCGLSTLAMVLNALRIDPMRTWKGAWRWFNEHNLGCCMEPEEVRKKGLSFDMFDSLAGCNGARVTSYRSPLSSDGNEALAAFTEQFRHAVRLTTESSARECLVICYSREKLGQTGAGHFSPIGGYHEVSDCVLILDVARFKYPPHWARLSDIAAAMAEIDAVTGRPRGYFHLSVPPVMPEDGRWVVPLKVPSVPAAAGRRLSKALYEAMTAESIDFTPRGEASSVLPATIGLSRWLRAVSSTEPQVLGQLLRIGDQEALREVLERLEAFAPYRKLCAAYASVAPISGCSGEGGCPTGGLPPLRFGPNHIIGSDDDGDLSLETCGELWVLLLLLMPEHLRSAAFLELAGPQFPQDMAKAVKGPWALPLEAIRDALSRLLPAEEPGKCAHRPKASFPGNGE